MKGRKWFWRSVCLCLLSGLVVGVLYFFGIVSFANIQRGLDSESVTKRLDALILVAERGAEGARWSDPVVRILQQDPSSDVREMAVIALREIGPSPRHIAGLQSALQTETEDTVRFSILELLDQWDVTPSISPTP